MRGNRHTEGLKFARTMMVLSSISPVFILWGIRGNSLIPDPYFIGVCVIMVVGPNFVLYWRIKTAKRNRDLRKVIVGSADDHRDHLIVYLVAVLLPLYAANLSTWRDMIAALVALGLIVFIFWHLNLHYVNLAFAALGYRVFTLYPPCDGNPLSGRTTQTLITKRDIVPPGLSFVAYRVSDTVFLEEGG